MTQTLADKQRIVADINAAATQAYVAIAADYRGLTVAEMTELRSRAREHNVYLRVMKNTLARRGFHGTGCQCMSDGLSGPLLFAFSQEDTGAAARLMRDFAKSHDKLKVKMIAAGGVLMDISAVDLMANLPSRDGAIAMLMAVMRAPITQLACSLLDIPARLVRVFAAVKDQQSHSLER